MPAKQQILKGMVAVSKAPKDSLLGYITWYSVPDVSISLGKLRSALLANGINPDLAPDNNRAINVFKRAMREQEGRRRENGHIIDTDVADVVETPKDCVYQVSVLRRDAQERVVDYPKAVRVIFNKDTDALRFNFLDQDVNRSDVVDMVDRIQAYFKREQKKVTGARVRTLVRTYLRSEPDEKRGIEGLSGTNLRETSGGIYFIPAQHASKLAALTEVLNECYPGRAYLHAVPLADSSTEREIVQRHFMSDVTEQVDDTVAELADLLSDPNRKREIRSDYAKRKWSEHEALRRKADRYSKLLGKQQRDVAEKADILKAQLEKLGGL